MSNHWNKEDLLSMGEIAALDGVSLEAFISKLMAEGYGDRQRMIAIRGYRKFVK